MEPTNQGEMPKLSQVIQIGVNAYPMAAFNFC
jgi:hypothetical protein